jgi:Domain of unknown function (DUF4815)
MSDINTDLSASPYNDDFDQSANYYRIPFKASTPVQVRELNQIQSMLQDQINKFGRNIYKDGSVVEGCVFSFDNNISYVKISDNYTNSTAFTVSDFVNRYVYNDEGLKAQILDTSAGYLSQAPNTNTLYIKYINAATYSNGSPKSVFDPNDNLYISTSSNTLIGTVTVASNSGNANVGKPTGSSFRMSVTEGVIFKSGIFLRVPPQSVLVSQYTNRPDNVSVGFENIETIITATANSALYDNALGSPNYSAPGADRLQIIPNLVVKNSDDIANSSVFFSLADFTQGVPTTLKQTAQYSAIGTEMARRAYETNGDFVVTPFNLSTLKKANTSDPLYHDYNNLIISQGKGYVKGYRVEFLNNNIVDLRKGTDYSNAYSQIVSANFGYYVQVKEFAGEFGDSSDVIQVQLHNVSKKALTNGTNLATTYSGTTQIGSASVRGFAYDSGILGTPNCYYDLYLFNISMNAGASFSDVMSILYVDTGSLEGIADVVLDYANNAIIQSPSLNTLIYPFGQKALKTDGFNNTQFVYRKRSTSSFGTTGNSSITLGAAIGTGIETFNQSGTLSQPNQLNFIVIPTSAGRTANLSGTVTVTSTSNVVTGSGTSFLSQYSVGDTISANGSASGIVSLIVNNTSMACYANLGSSVSNVSHWINYPIGVPIPFGNRSDRSIVISGNTATLVLNHTLNSSFNIEAYYDVLRASTVPMSKHITRSSIAKINVATHTNGKLGPWSLGVPDVFDVTAVYLDDTGGYSTSGTNYRSQFKLDRGHRDCHYDLASLKLAPSALPNLIKTNTAMTIVYDCYTVDETQGRGFFLASSYPIDDINGSANTSAITTPYIPKYTSTKGTTYDLRDCVDFRVIASNTATITTTLGSATINPSSTLAFNDLPYLPSPDSNFETDFQYYLPRQDRIGLDINGNVKVFEGKPALVGASAPPEKADIMTLGLANIPPYPSLSNDIAKSSGRYDYAVNFKISQNNRYTMKDIGVLDQRIKNLEYYTSLSLLEQSAADLQVRSSNTGQNRFQNGLFADPFKGFDLSDVTDPQFRVSIDGAKTEMRPAFQQLRSDFTFDSANSSGVSQYGELVMLNHTSVPYITQPFASSYRNVTEGNIYIWNGTIKLTPSGTVSPDLSTPPTVINNVDDLSANWTTLSQAFQTQWGNWVDAGKSTSKVVKDSYVNSVTAAGNPASVITVEQTAETFNITTTPQQRTGYTLDVDASSNTFNLGTFVTGVKILPYLKAAYIEFEAHGMKPNTHLYAFFSDVAVSAYCAPLNPDYTYNIATANSGNFGDSLITNRGGSVYGIFYLPANTFASEVNDFLLCDVPDRTVGANAITTTAKATFYGSKESLTMGTSSLTIRNPIVTADVTTQDQTLTQWSTNTVTTTTKIVLPTQITQTQYSGGDGNRNPGDHPDNCGCSGSVGGGGGAGSD